MERAERYRASLTDEGHYRLLVEAITDYAIYMINPQGIIVSWNAGARRLKGYETSEITGAHFSSFYVEEDRRAGLPERALAIAVREGRFETEGWRVRKNGSCFWANVVIDPIRAPLGTLVGFAKITRDLTERRAAQEALRRVEAQFRTLVEGITDCAIYMLDPDGRVTSWNAGAERITGYRAEEIVGRDASCLRIQPDRDLGLPEAARATAAREGRFAQDGWRVRKDGTLLWAHVVIDAVRDLEGALIGFATVTRDISEQVGLAPGLRAPPAT